MSYNSNMTSQTGNSNNMQDGRQPENVHTPTLSQDEVRVLKECNNESFYYRCVPLSTLFSGLAFIAMNNGYIAKSSKYGYVPKMMAGALIGYVVGKVSYQSMCAEKIMRLPDSNLADALRKRRGQVSFKESLSTEPGFSHTGAPSADFVKDNTIFDERRPDLSEHNDGMDSYNTVTESLSPYSGNDDTSSKSDVPCVSYDDLRRDNREEYANKLSEKYRKQNSDPIRPMEPPSSFPGSSSFSPSFPDSSSRSPFPEEQNRRSSPKPDPYFNPKKNKYGDVWDE